MPGKLTLYPPQRASRFLILRDEESLEIGRDTTCDLVLEDARVSKRQARLRWTGGGWALEDVGSKNGTLVNGKDPAGAALQDGDWISLGGLMARFERLTAAQAATLDSQRLARLQTSAEMRRRLSGDLEPIDLLLRFLESAMEVTQTERGFVLVAGPGGRLRPEVAAGFSVGDLWEERFRGSVGAVKQALEVRGPVVVSDAHADPRLGKRPSVVAQGIGCLACVPLRHEENIIGVIYVDSRKLGPAFTAMDIQILEALADYTASVLAEALLHRRNTPPNPPPAQRLVAELQQRIDELLPAV
ncbi:MAG TPA: FHA domain-containing protein [Vicinamibacteria bacterium]|jgi:adenylate cyclase|nr:FHA domain-containing protein [Vicinamibacteria bacterium]